jgi:hypothetical protein
VTRFNKTWLSLFVLGAVLTPVCFLTGPYVELTAAMAPDKPFDEKPATSLDNATTRFTALTTNAKQVYRSHLVHDVAFFVSMGLASAALLMLAWGPQYKRRTYVAVLFFTFAFMILDASENAILWTWFSNDGPTEPTIIPLLSATRAKFAAITLTVPVLLLGLILRFRRPDKEAANDPNGV